MNANIFRGVGVALVTPFTATKAIDYSALENIINHTITNGVDFLVCLGTTGESPTISDTEKKEVLSFTKKINAKRVPLVFGIGGFNTQEVIDSFTKYDLTDVDAILCVSPYYSKPSQEGIYQHFVAINGACPVPVIAYNVPGRTGANMHASTIVRIANDCENVIAIKDACGNIAQNMEVISNAPSGFVVLSGDDDLVLPQIAIGVQGVISVAANCYTKDFCTMTHLALAGNIDEARVIHYKLLNKINLLFADGNPPGVKYVLHKMGICANECRLPVVPVSAAVAAQIDEAIA
jgi:4-hydroxy-tetrahydrodipicolinate synthase